MQKTEQDFRHEEWKLQAEQCQSSGKTVRAWCEENGIKPKTYYYRLSKVRGAACHELALNKSKGAEASGAPVFAEVGKGRSGNGYTAISLRLNSAEVEIYNGAEAAVIENTLRILRELC